jgi:DNA mismatch repair protein MLH1
MAFFNQPEPVDSPSEDEEIRQQQTQQHDTQIWQLKHVVFPALRYFEAPGSLIDSKSVVHVASLENLYKVFERC